MSLEIAPQEVFGVVLRPLQAFVARAVH
jgi:hypothetical protein